MAANLLTTTSRSPSTIDDEAARRARFIIAWDSIRDQLIVHVQQHLPSDACDWYRQSLDYNVPGGKLNRGLTVVDSTETLLGRSLTDGELSKAMALGWCVELLQAYFLVSDDIADKCLVRRSQPCYYKLPGVGLIAVNDGHMLSTAIYHLLRQHFRSDPCYTDLMELFQDVTYKTEMGQLIDLITASEDVVDLGKFSLERHHQIVVYKTAYYSFYLPVALAMRLAGIPDTYTHTSSTSSKVINAYETAQSILIPLGEYFQVQDDWLDYTGTVEQIGKIGTDIIDNKCSWCINVALAWSTPEQRAILDANYGRKGKDEEEKVKKIFEEVNVAAKYKKYEEDACERIMNLIEELPEDPKPGELKREVFIRFLQKIYKRSI